MEGGGGVGASIYVAIEKPSSMRGMNSNMAVLELPIFLPVTPHSGSVSPLNSLVSQGEFSAIVFWFVVGTLGGCVLFTSAEGRNSYNILGYEF